MELYFSDYNHYPIWESGCLTSGNPLTADTTSSPAFFTSQYMKTVPKDPLPNKYCYYYKSDSAGVNFKMAAYLEKDTARSTNDGGTATYYYEVYAGPTGSGTAIPLSDDTLNTAMAGAPPGPPVSWTVDGLIYTTRKKLTIDQTKVDDDLIDFPVLVKLTSSNFDFSKANADGYDIRFTSSDGVTLLKYERERHDSANSLAEHWVKVPSVSGATDTDIYMYYHTTDTADGADPTNVWDANFKGVWHSKDITTSTINDSTAIENNGTKKAANEPIEADGKIAKGQSFDGSNDFIQIPNSSQLNPDYITVEAWAKPSKDSAGSIISKIDDPNPGGNEEIYIRDRGSIQFLIRERGGNVHTFDAGNLTDNQWNHVVGTYNGTVQKLYINGVEVGSTSWTGKVSNFLNPIRIGRWWEGDPLYFSGIIDEVRVLDVARSVAWIKADYNSGNNSLLTYGSEEIKQ